MTKVHVQPGACGLNSTITVTRVENDDDDYLVDIHIETESDNIKRLAKVLTQVNNSMFIKNCHINDTLLSYNEDRINKEGDLNDAIFSKRPSSS